MSRFNLVDEKWIPVRFPDGTRDELGIRETLLRSREIAAIEDPSPLVVAALHRFLLAVLYRALEGPTDIDQAKTLFKEKFPTNRITNYLEKWTDRFWLFDAKYPFGQNPNIPRNEIEPWTKLTAEHNATSNKVLFDHTDTKKPGACEAKACARWLLSTMSFSISGGRGYYPSPSPNAIMCIPQGRNLKDTLCYNLVPYPNQAVMRDDSALWEREPKNLPLAFPKQAASGFADLYTWQPRMVLLEENSSGDVSVMRFVAGQGFENPSGNPDPMQAYKADISYGKLPLQFKKDRGAWRDFDSLLPDTAGLAPLSIQNSLRIGGATSRPNSVMVLGLKYEPPNANLEFWRMERYILPNILNEDKFFRTSIRDLLDMAEDGYQALRSSVWKYQRHSVIHNERKREDDVRKEERILLNKMVDATGCTQLFWSTLESGFHVVLRNYSEGTDSDDIRCLWVTLVRDSLSSAWEQHSSSVAIGNVWAIRALVRAEGPVLRKISELNEEVSKLARGEGDA
jgi:CRISPR system Cascade subunit CasA